MAKGGGGSRSRNREAVLIEPVGYALLADAAASAVGARRGGVGTGEVRSQNREGIAGLPGGDLRYLPPTNHPAHDAALVGKSLSWTKGQIPDCVNHDPV